MATMSANRAAALGFIEYFNTLDVEAGMANRSADCQQILAPASVGGGPHNNEAIKAGILESKNLLAGFEMSVTKVWEGPDSVTVWARSVGKLQPPIREAFPDANYNGEYIFVFEFNQEGKISNILEFVDSKAIVEGRGLIQKIQEKFAPAA